MPYKFVHATCPACKKPHVDEGRWAEDPHQTHLCVDDAAGKGCGARWDHGWPAVAVLPVRDFTCRMYAEQRGGEFWHQHEKRWFVELCATKGCDIVEVEVREDPEGPYHGWMEAGSQVPCFVWPSEAQRDICFFEGSIAAERAGKGRRVRLACALAGPRDPDAAPADPAE